MPIIPIKSRPGACIVSERTRETPARWTSSKTGGPSDKRPLSAREVAFARDSYDDCIADLDEQLGLLYDELESRASSGRPG